MSETESIIPKGTSICPSERGHNNFFYPVIDKSTILTEDVKVRLLSWTGGGDLSAFKIVGQKNIVWTKKKYVKELDV